MDNELFGVLFFGFLMVLVFGINYFTQRVDLDKVSQHKKNKYLTWFWYFPEAHIVQSSNASCLSAAVLSSSYDPATQSTHAV